MKWAGYTGMTWEPQQEFKGMHAYVEFMRRARLGSCRHRRRRPPPPLPAQHLNVSHPLPLGEDPLSPTVIPALLLETVVIGRLREVLDPKML